MTNAIIDSINRFDILRKKIFNNIILGGGNTFIKGFGTRLKIGIDGIKKEIVELLI